MALRSKKHRILTIVAATLLVAGSLTPATACGPFFVDDVFQSTAHPDFPLKKFAAGQLGLVNPGFARSYLIVAYRYLTDHPLSSQEQSDIVQLWERRITQNNWHNSDTEIENWKTARKKIGGAANDVDIDCNRGIGKRQDYGGFTDFYLNCSSEAFVKAVQTLHSMVGKYGSGSQPVKDWLAAQDLVFAHCGDPAFDYNTKKVAPEPAFPTPLATGDETEKANRAYQIACAHFYAAQFDEANKEFTAIAADPSSPWHELAPYLAARAILRKATLSGGSAEHSLLQTAQEQFQKIVADSGLANAHGVAKQLLSFIQARLNPEDRMSVLADRISKAQDEATFAADVSDFTTLYDRQYDTADDSDNSAKKTAAATSPKLAANDLFQWVKNFQDQSPGAFETARKKWQQTHSTAWLVAALCKMKAATDNSELDQAAQIVSSSSPAYWTTSYYLASALSGTKNSSEAKAIADKLLATANGVSPSAVNAVKNLQLSFVSDVNGFLSAAIQVPAGASDFSDGTDVPSEFDQAEKSNTYFHVAPAFAPDAAKFLNARAPLAILEQVALSDKLPVPQQLDALQAAWTRAALLGDDAAVIKITPKLAAARPALKPLLDAYVNAKVPEEKKFAAANMFLKNPAMRPYITAGAGRQTKFSEIDDYQNNWWCGDKAGDFGESADDTENAAINIKNFLTPAQKSTAVVQLKTLRDMGPAGNFLLSASIAWAHKNPGDARLPEALYHAIRVPKFSCYTPTTQKLSHTAYDLMHSQYPKNPWTAKTKYWY